MPLKSYLVIAGADSNLGCDILRYFSNNTQCGLVAISRKAFTLPKGISSDRILRITGIDLTLESHCIKMAQKVDVYCNGQFNLINCTGYFPGYKSINSIDICIAKKVLHSNVLAVYGATYSLLPLMKKRKGGRIFAFSSHTAYQNYPQSAIFSASKHALESLMISIANEYGKYRISTFTLSLATLLTNTERKIKPFGDHKNWLQPTEVARTIDLLLDERCSCVNGSILHLYKHSDTFFNQSYYERIRHK